MTLRKFAASQGIDVGCADNSCIWGPPGGMATNGGCRCVDWQDPLGTRQELYVALRVANLALKTYGEKHDD